MRIRHLMLGLAASTLLPMTALAQFESATPSTATPTADIDATAATSGALGTAPDAQHPAVRLIGDWPDAMQTADDAVFVQFMQEHAPGIPGSRSSGF